MHTILAQTMAEYGLLTALAAKISAIQYRLEAYIGTGNTKYLLIAALLLVLVLLIRRRRI